MKKHISWCEEMAEPIRARSAPLNGSLFSDEEAIAELIGEFPAPPETVNCRCEIIPTRTKWNPYLLYGALLGVLEALVLFAYFFRS